MTDKLRLHELAKQSQEAQLEFDRAAAKYRQASKAAAAAETARVQASEALQLQFDRVVIQARELRDAGGQVRVCLDEVELFKRISRGRELGEIESALERCAPTSLRA